MPDRLLGVAFGILLGVGIIVAFVFLGSERTIDAPSLHATSTIASPGGPQGGNGGKPTEQATRTVSATIDIVGGAPPAAGPPQLTVRKGDQVELRVTSDEDIELELIGYGIRKTVPAGRPVTLPFTASKTGNFALVVAASHIGVAELRVKPASG